MKTKIATAALLLGCQALYSSALGMDGSSLGWPPANAPLAHVAKAGPEAPGFSPGGPGGEDLAASQGQPPRFKRKRGRGGKHRHGPRGHGRRRLSSTVQYPNNPVEGAPEGGPAGNLKGNPEGNACCAPAAGCM